MNIFIDIETIPSQMMGVRESIAESIRPPGNMSKAETIAEWERTKKAAAVEEKWLKTSFDGSSGTVVVISFAIEDRPPFIVQIGDEYTNPALEKRLLEMFMSALEQEVTRWLHLAMTPEQTRTAVFGVLESCTWVGHYVRDFDLRFLYQRMVVHNVKPLTPNLFPLANGNKYRVFDTMTEWCGWGNRCSLDSICQALGIDGKGSELGGEDIDGSKVWQFIQDGRLADVATYCAADVERARKIYKRLTFQ